MEKLEYIQINIWDDFCEDGYVPKSEKSETYIYVEDIDIPQEKRKEYLETLLDYINKNLNTNGIKLWMELYESRKKYPNLIGVRYESMLVDRWEIKLEGITHERLEEWMKVLENVNIKVDGIPLYIYSES